MLLRFHVVLISFAILFCFGFSVYEILAAGRDGVDKRMYFGFVAAAAGIALAFYLLRVLRRGIRS